jgi:hypothetical protein
MSFFEKYVVLEEKTHRSQEKLKSSDEKRDSIIWINSKSFVDDLRKMYTQTIKKSKA